jgi:LysM repeat protein
VAPAAPGVGTLTARQNSAYAYTLPAFSDANGNALSYSVSQPAAGPVVRSGHARDQRHPADSGQLDRDLHRERRQRRGDQHHLHPDRPGQQRAHAAVGGRRRPVAWAAGLSLTLPAFADADYDALSYSVSNLPPGLSFNPATLVISGTPTTAGSWTVTYTANDGRGGVSNTTFTFTINASAPANRAPVVSVPIDDQYAFSGDYFVFTIPANTFTDPDNNPLTYTATLSSGAALPAWLSFNAATRTFSGVPGGINNQTLTIRVRATDPSGLSVTDDFFLYKEGTGGGGPLDGVPVDEPSLQAAAIAPNAESVDDDLMSRSWDVAPVRESPNPLPGPDVEPYGLSQSIVPDAAPVPQTDGEQTVVANAPVTTAMAATTTATATAAASSIPVNDVQQEVAIDDIEPIARLYSFDMGTGPALAGSASILEIQPTGDTSATNPVPMINALATSVPVQIKDEWFVYDAENRLKLVGGQLVGTAGAQGTYIGLGASGVESYELMYDAVGQVVGRSVKSGDNQIVYRTTYDLRGRKQYEFHGEYLNPVNFEFGGISKQYTYDAADRMIETRSYYQNGTRVQAPLDGEGFPQGPDMHVSGWISSAETLTYDADGRLTLQINLERNNGINGIQWFEPWDYDDTLQRTSLTVLIEDSRVMYTDQFGNSGYDSVGRVSTYRYTAKAISWATHTYTSSYEGWEGYVEKFLSGVSTNNNYRATTNTLTYDAFGKLIKQIENTPLPSNLGTLEDRARAYTYNGDGRVLTRREGKIVSNVFTQTADASGANPNYLFVHAAGQQQAELREGGQIRTWNGGTYDTPQIQTLNGSGNYAAGGGTVTAQQGETLQSLAQRVYGNSSLWYVLADANGLSDPDAGLIAGTQLNTPKVTVSNNDANTFRPYDPSEAIGPTSPGLPYITPPPKKSCNVIAMVLMVVVAVVVTVFTAGAAAMAMGVVSTASGATGIMAIGGAALTGGLAGAGVAAGSMLAVAGATTIAAGSAAAIGGAVAAGFVGGFMGSVASQVVGKALGVVDHFSLRSAFSSGLTAGFSAGIGSAGIVGQLAGKGEYAHIARGAISGAVGGVTSYAANRIAGIDVSFSWKSIAAGAVSGAISAGIGKSLGLMPDADQKISNLRSFGNDFATGLIGGVTRVHVRRTFGFDDKIDYAAITADAFGNALGNATVKAMVDHSLRRQREQFDARIEKKRASLPEEDRNNPLFYSLSDKIDPSIKRDLWAKYQAGEITFNRVATDLGSATAAYDPSKGENGTIALNAASLELTQDADFGAMFGALVVWGDLQEVGHQLDEMAWRAMGVSGGDSLGDEGAVFAYMQFRELQQRSDPSTGLISYGLNFGGKSVTLQADSTMLSFVAMHEVYSGSISRENRTSNGIEYFNAGGHYYSTFAITYDTTLAATGNRNQSYSLAQKLSLASQLPDMIWELDAYSQYMHAAPRFTDSEIAHMTTIMSTFHNLAPEGQGTAAWLRQSREAAGQLVTEAISEGRYVLAGFAIHKLGDSYAHTYLKNGEYLPYEAPHGHGAASAVGADPDNIHAKPALARAYARDLSGRIAAGLGVSAANISSVVSAGVGSWTAAFDSSMSNATSHYINAKTGMRSSSFDAGKGNQLFIDRIVAYEASVRGSRDIGLVPDQYLHTQQGAVANLVGFGSAPARVTKPHYDLLVGQNRSQVWEAYQAMLQRFRTR